MLSVRVSGFFLFQARKTKLRPSEEIFSCFIRSFVAHSTSSPRGRLFGSILSHFPHVFSFLHFRIYFFWLSKSPRKRESGVEWIFIISSSTQHLYALVLSSSDDDDYFTINFNEVDNVVFEAFSLHFCWDFSLHIFQYFSRPHPSMFVELRYVYSNFLHDSWILFCRYLKKGKNVWELLFRDFLFDLSSSWGDNMV